MSRRIVLLSVILLSGLAGGCRGSLLLNPYANTVDDINDTHVYFDNLYRPHWDISRAGKPDWCSPFNSRLGKNICYLGCYDRYDDCNLYPPSNPYSFPSNTLSEPKVWTPTPGAVPVKSGSPTPLPPAVETPPAPGPVDDNN